MDQPGRAGNYPERSASAMLSYAFLKGHRLSVLEPRFADAGRRAFDGIAKRYLRISAKGTALGGINGEFGYRDGTFAYYVGEPVVENDPKGGGPLMMAQAERLWRD